MPGIEDIAGALGSKALDWVDTAVQYYNQKKLNRQAQKDTQQNMQLQKELNLQQLVDSYSASVFGMRRAGLNPALAVGGVGSAQGVSMAAGNAGAAAKPDNSAPAALEAATAFEKQDSEIELNKAAADKAKEEAERIRIENQHSRSGDKMISPIMYQFLNEIAGTSDNPFIRGIVESVMENGVSFDVGALEGFSKMFFDFSQRERDRELDYIAKEYDKKVQSYAYGNDEIAQSAARRPYDERMHLYKSMALMNMQIYALASEASLTEDKRTLLMTQVRHLEQVIRQIYHGDYAAMGQAGDWSAFMYRIGAESIEQVANGLGFGAGMAAGSRLLGGVKPQTSMFQGRLDAGSDVGRSQTATFNKAMQSKSQYLPAQNKPFKMEQPRQLRQANLEKQLAKMREDGTKYTKPQLYWQKHAELMEVKYGKDINRSRK